MIDSDFRFPCIINICERSNHKLAFPCFSYHKFSTREDTVILTVRNVARLGSFNALKDVSFDEKAINGLICFNSVRSWCPI